MSITKKRILQLAKSLEISHEDTLLFLESLESSAEIKSDFEVDLALFELMSDWYYDAIIELVKIEDIDKSDRAISKYLGITITQAKLAIEQLKKFEIILEADDGGLVCNQHRSLTQFFENSFTNTALKNYQAQILDLSKDALYSQPRNQRNHTSHVIALDSSLVEEVNNRIKEFQQELTQFIEKKSQQKDKVYAIQFTNFELTKKRELQ